MDGKRNVQKMIWKANRKIYMQILAIFHIFQTTSDLNIVRVGRCLGRMFA